MMRKFSVAIMALALAVCAPLTAESAFSAGINTANLSVGYGADIGRWSVTGSFCTPVVHSLISGTADGLGVMDSIDAALATGTFLSVSSRYSFAEFGDMRLSAGPLLSLLVQSNRDGGIRMGADGVPEAPPLKCSVALAGGVTMRWETGLSRNMGFFVDVSLPLFILGRGAASGIFSFIPALDGNSIVGAYATALVSGVRFGCLLRLR